MARVVDLAAVRSARKELEQLAAAHPELTGAKGEQNRENWIQFFQEQETDMQHAQNCAHCGHGFLAERSTKRFCSNGCRAAWNRRKAPPSKTTEALQHAADMSASFDAAKGFFDERDIKAKRDAAFRAAIKAIETELKTSK